MIVYTMPCKLLAICRYVFIKYSHVFINEIRNSLRSHSGISLHVHLAVPVLRALN